MSEPTDLHAILADAEAMLPLPQNIEDAPDRTDVVEVVKRGLAAESFAEAEAAFAEARELLVARADATGVADLDFQWGDTAIGFEEFEVGKAKLKLALGAYRALGQQSMIGQVRISLGAMHSIQQEHDKARQQYIAAELAFEKAEDLDGVANARVGLGAALHKAGELHDALDALDSAFELFMELDDQDSVTAAASLLADVFDDLGRPDEAAEIRAAARGEMTPEQAEKLTLDFIRDHGEL